MTIPSTTLPSQPIHKDEKKLSTTTPLLQQQTTIIEAPSPIYYTPTTEKRKIVRKHKRKGAKRRARVENTPSQADVAVCSFCMSICVSGVVGGLCGFFTHSSF